MITFRSVRYSVKGNDILNGLDLEIQRGETMVLLGESGCGKTTTLKMVNRLLEPTEGEVLVNGKRTRDHDPIWLRRQIGYVIQDAGLFPHMTVAENVGIVPRLAKWETARSASRISEMLELVGLEPAKFADRLPHELSGGQRQRVGVARALAADPEILLLDEPFGALDALTRTSLQKEFSNLFTQLDKTVVFVTHDLHEAMLMASRIALMANGEIVVLAAPADFALSGHPLARAYLETVAV